MSNWLSIAKKLRSVHKANGLGWVLYMLVREYRPVDCVEFGVLHGYSTLFIGGALQANGTGHLHSFDMWPGHLREKGIEAEARSNVVRAGLGSIVTIETRDVMKEPPPLASIDFLFMDIDNCGAKLGWALRQYGDKLTEKGVIVCEGGSPARDGVEWMLREKRVPIRQTLENLKGWNWYVIDAWPSLTILKRGE